MVAINMFFVALFILILISCASFAIPKNVWDYNDIEIIDHSGILDLKDNYIDNIFRESNGKQYIRNKLVIFEDNMPDGYAHFVEWKTKRPHNLKTLELYANCDLPNTARKLSRWCVYGKKSETDSWTLIYDYLFPKGVLVFEDAGKYRVKTADVSTDSYSYFRSEFIQNGAESANAAPIINGIKAYDEILELDISNKKTEDKYATIILHVQDIQGNTGFQGLKKIIAATKKRNLYDKIKYTIILDGKEARYPKTDIDFLKSLYNDGHEIGCELSNQKGMIADLLEMNADEITTIATQLFGDADLEEEVRQNVSDFTASAHACVEGNSLAEFWDIPHNWEGAPMFPYYVQWNDQMPLNTARTNRELDKDKAVLELTWSTRPLWHNYDRYPIPQVWHFGEPSKPNQWRVGQLVKGGSYGGWWNAELAEYEKNYRAKRTPFLYLSVTQETSWFSDIIRPQVDPEECMNNGLDMIEMFIRNGWSILTVKEFVNWYTQKWPCPQAPAMVYLMEDTLANREDRDGKTIVGHGHIVHVETKHFQICDSDNRIAPELVIAYDCKTPNLLRNGYTFANPEKYPLKETYTGRYASTTGNAIFWSPSEPLTDVLGSQYYESYKSEDCKMRTFTFYFGDSWEEYQFVKGEFSRIKRISDEEITWTKEMINPAEGTDISLKYIHTIKADKHIIKIDIDGDDAVGQNAKFRISPYFHQGWDLAPAEDLNDPYIPDWRVAGQERNVFAKVNGIEFEYLENNAEDIVKKWNVKEEIFQQGIYIDVFNRNPGIGKTCDDNPILNRGFTLHVDKAIADVSCIDLAGPNEYVTCEIDLGKHKRGQSYVFTFKYWQGEKK